VGPFPGATTETVDIESSSNRAAALVSGGGNVYPFYTLSAYDPVYRTRIKYGIGFTPYDSPEWVFESMATSGSNAHIGNPAPVIWNNSIWVAFETQPFGGARTLGLNPPSAFLGLPISPPQLIPIPTPYLGSTTDNHGATLVVFQNQLWAFYTSSPRTGNEAARFSVYNGTAFTRTNVLLDSIAASGGPAPIVYQGYLVVFYLDEVTHQLVVKYSSDGVNFGKSTISPTPAFTSWNVHLAPGVDTNGVLHVFFVGGNGSLFDASAYAPWGPFTVLTVDPVTAWAEPAAVAWAGSQVYYIDTLWNTLKGAWFDGANWEPSVIDGAGSSLCASQGGGATSNRLGGPIAVAVPSTGPQVFYKDANTGDLRIASWY
jgi:hypothetical protein